MLSKKFRLPIQNFINKKGKSVKSRFFLLKDFGTAVGFSRFGIIISAKVSKKAVERNRIKRTLFNFLQDKRNKLPISDYLIIVYPEAANLKKEELQTEVSKILNLEIEN